VLFRSDTVYVATMRGTVYALDAVTGAQRWAQTVEGAEYRTTPVVANASLVAIGTILHLTGFATVLDKGWIDTAVRDRGIAGEADCILIPEIPVDWEEVYRHMKKVYLNRIKESDINAGTYTIVVAEGLKNASGEPIYDEFAGLDSFGHKKLAGAGKYVAQELNKRLKTDGEIKEFMRREAMFVEDLYTVPEVRTIVPSHLVRSGFTSAFDANFGMEAGANAVILLLNGIDGVTVTGYHENTVRYMDIQEAIKQRHVDPAEVALFEQLGFSFGRVRTEYSPECRKVGGRIERIY